MEEIFKKTLDNLNAQKALIEKKIDALSLLMEEEGDFISSNPNDNDIKPTEGPIPEPKPKPGSGETKGLSGNGLSGTKFPSEGREKTTTGAVETNFLPG